MSDRVSVFGLGKLGASMTAAMASRGFEVVGVDINEAAVQAMNEGRAPVQETGLEALIQANRARIHATTSTDEAIARSDLSFVIVPTPSDDEGSFSLQYLRFALAGIGRALRAKDSYHVIVITSTVLPGSTRHGLIPTLEAESGKTCGEDFGVCYSPEFIALGTVIRDFLNPDFYLVGEFDTRSGDALEAVNRKVCQNDAPCRRMSIENAELAKIALNSYVTMKISFANMLADLCERIPGGDVDVVSDALGSDTRIGRRYLTGGLGFGGPCFPRDNVALAYFGRQLGASVDLLDANDRYNRSLAQRLVERLQTVLEPQSTVAVLGLAYKPHSHVVEASPGIFLSQALSEAGMRVLAFDPLATTSARTVLQYQALVVDSIESALEDAEAVLVATADPMFVALEPAQLLGRKKSLRVIDFWRAMSATVREHPAIDYVPIGRCLDDDAQRALLAALWAPPRPSVPPR